MTVREMDRFYDPACACGKAHRFEPRVIIGNGAILRLPQVLQDLHARRVFLLADQNTFSAAGENVCRVLEEADIPVSRFVFPQGAIEPDETAVGLAVMHFDPSCDVVLGVGSGVINDISKILAATSAKPYVIVATAPSMDGYASATSSMIRGGLKISLPSKCADVIVGDLDVLCAAPKRMMVSGLGDMLAKFVSICEWRIGNLITGEYYCPVVAQQVRDALQKCMDNAASLLDAQPEAVAAVFEGLVLCGAAMNYAGVSRPASGVEHYMSHVWDMRSVEFGTTAESHGIQCGLGTLLAVRLYEKLKTVTPNREKALAYAQSFDYPAWAARLKEFLGAGADAMIALEEKEGKYNVQNHALRLERILEKWPQILAIAEEELPASSRLEALLQDLGAPVTMAQMGLEEALFADTFRATKDIRDKYVLSRLAWDLGVLEELIG